MIFLKSPRFWYEKPGLLQKLFLTLPAAVYARISERNYRQNHEYESRTAKVIAVGGITVGGSGKTQVVKSFCEILKSKNKKAAVLSRGFGGTLKKPQRVNAAHSCREVGDEAMLLSSVAPVFVGRDRAACARLAEKKNIDFLILDDGLTQRFLKPNVKLVVIDREQGFGNGEMFPLGPNRLDFEKIKFDLDGAIILGNTPENCEDPFADCGIPVFKGTIEPDFSGVEGKIVAFCGIGYPDKFFGALRGLEIAEKIPFPDHYPFSDSDVRQLIEKAKKYGARLATTEKDFVRIPPKYRSFVTAIPAKIVWSDPVDRLLDP
ncbi:MAG: tetraacyldisaccharide 4'-kinase [Holosporaceae bacterium]|jgi:tetraacyldisaccharide 4'-kinase|nr:tetraacyldisaccharide 4'-kinase [Holosporaceae bacterium]